jgi:hypothetical protein
VVVVGAMTDGDSRIRKNVVVFTDAHDIHLQLLLQANYMLYSVGLRYCSIYDQCLISLRISLRHTASGIVRNSGQDLYSQIVCSWKRILEYHTAYYFTRHALWTLC